MKYNHFLMLLTTGALAPVVTAQDQHPNLVQNGGFETLAEPVTTWDQLDRATGWSNANLGSVDVYGKGAASNTVGIPQNDQGSTEAFEGASYAGFVAWKDEQQPTWPKALNEPMWWNKHDMTDWNPYTEYLQIALGSPLTAGQKYVVKFQVKLAGNSDRAVSGIGAYMAPNEVALRHCGPIMEMPDVVHKEVVRDRQNWTTVTGVFTADGTERFVVIGAFPEADMKKENAVEGWDQQRAYYYIDGVEVRLKPEDDRDKDGIVDKEDSCPDQAGPASTKGCPDTDGDGVADKDDRCKDMAGPANQSGCPDTDGDGIIDPDDRCPKVAGVASMRGCPELKEETKKLFEKALTGIQFETGSSKIKSSSFPILNDVVKVMQENPSYELDIHGHTDNTGNADKNLQLSKDRAAAVREYLVKKGVGGDRLRSEGFGQTEPVADNSTPAGRAKNRRVEFKVTYMQ